MGEGKRIVAIGRNDHITVDNGWAQLDDANKSDGHYQRKHPELDDARDALQKLEREEVEIIDRMTNEAVAWHYPTWHPCRDFPRYIQLQGEIDDARTEYDRLYTKYNGQQTSEGTFIHNITITNKVPKWEKSAEKA